MLKFIVDENVGKLARWLRMMGFDSVFFNSGDDSSLVRQALAEGRILLTRDTEISKRRVVTTRRLKAVLFSADDPAEQMRQLLLQFDILAEARPFTICLEDNEPLVPKTPTEVKERVPPYVFKNQEQYMECPLCRRIYWRGTHWAAMKKWLEKLSESPES